MRLLAHDPERRALLLERCTPGTPLGTEYDDASLEIAASLMHRLWRRPPDNVPWRRLEIEAERWLDELPERYPGHPLLEVALDTLLSLGPAQEDTVLCHQDLHGGNILRAEREPWLAIDPKPIVAERAYDTVALVRDRGPHGLVLRDVRRRLDALSEVLELDRERMRRWGIAKSMAWDNPDEAKLFHELGSRR